VTLDEWIAKYNKKSPEPFRQDTGYSMYFTEDKGFCEIGFTGDMVIINQLCGDGRWWKQTVDRLAQDVNIHHGGTWCVRSAVRAYIRLFGYRIVEIEHLSDGAERYHCLDKYNREGLVSPAFKYDDGTQAYFVTWEI